MIPIIKLIFIIFLLFLYACENTSIKKNRKKPKPNLNTFFENITEEAPQRIEKNPLSEIYSKKPLNVAVFLPLSGNYAKIGEEGYEVVRLANSKLGNNLKITIFDTNSNKNSINYLHKKLQEDNFDLIIGPIFNFETKELANFERKIPILSLSNDKTIKFNNVITFGSSQNEKITDSVEFFTQNDKKNFVAIFPNNIQGSSNYKIFQKSVSANNGEIMRVEFYDDTGISDISKYVQKIINGMKETTYTSQDEQETLTQKQMSDLEAKNPNITKNYEEKTKSADVIFVSASGPYLEQIAKILRDAKLRGKLDEVSIFFLEVDFPITNPKLFEEIFFYSTVNLPSYQDFTDEYKSRTGKNPTKLGRILYDAIFYSTFVKNNSFGDIDLYNFSRQAHKFTGVEGNFIITREKIARRYGNIIFIKNSIPRIIEFTPQDTFSNTELSKEEDKFDENYNNLD
jgi:hypothetical protein